MDKKCVNCKKTLAAEAQICPFCGAEQGYSVGGFDEWDSGGLDGGGLDGYSGGYDGGLDGYSGGYDGGLDDGYIINPETEEEHHTRVTEELAAQEAARKKTRKKVAAIVSSCVCVILLCVCVSGFYTYHKCGDDATWELNDGQLTIRGSGAMGNASACHFRTRSGDIQSVIIENGITSVGVGAFEGFENLTSVRLGNSVNRIGDNAFESCDRLEKINVMSGNSTYEAEDGVLFTKDGARLILYPAGKSGQSYEIPDGVTTIAGNAFSDATLTEITVPESVTKIETNAFSMSAGKVYYEGTVGEWNDVNGTSQLSGVTVCCIKCGNNATWSIDGGTLTISGSGAMYDVYSESDRGYNSIADEITKVVIESGITSIGDMAFSGLDKLSGVTIGGGVTSIGDKAFYDCEKLSGVTIPDKVTSIGDDAFASCKNLSSVTIGSGVTSIGDSAFASCEGLWRITIPDNVTSMGDNVFSGCSSLTSVIMPDRWKTLDAGMFKNCSSLTSITLPDSLTTVEANVFSGCSALKKTVCASFSAWENMSIASGNTELRNGIYFADGTHLVESVTQQNGSDYRISHSKDQGETSTASGTWWVLDNAYNCVSFDLTYQITEITSGNPYGTFDICILKSDGSYEKVSTMSITSKSEVTVRVTFSTAKSVKGVTLLSRAAGSSEWKPSIKVSNLVVK